MKGNAGDITWQAAGAGILIGILLMQHSLVLGQQVWIDSMKHLIAGAKTDSARLNLEIDYATGLRKMSETQSLNELERIKKETIEKKLYKTQGRAANSIGAIYFDRGDYINSILSDEEAERSYGRLPQGYARDWGVAAAQINLGGTYSLINEWDMAQQYYYSGIGTLEKLRDSGAVTTSYFNLAFIFIDMEEWEKAYQYLSRSLQFAKGSKEVDTRLETTARLAAVCSRINRFVEARQLLKECDKMLRSQISDLAMTYYHNAYGDYFYFNKALDYAQEQHDLALKYARRWKDPYFIADEYIAIGKICLANNKIDSARIYLSMAYDTAKTYKYLPKIRIILSDWATFFARSGQYQKAYEYRSALNRFTDSLIKIQNHNRILLNDAKYQTVRKEQQIKQLEQEKKIQQLSLRQQSILNYVLVAGISAFALIGTLLYRNFRHKQQLSKQTALLQAQRIRELEQEKQLISFDALLKGQEEERRRLAKDLHDGLGGMLSGVKLSLGAMKGNVILSEENARLFARALEQLDNSIHEMRRVAHNMMPEALVKLGLQQAIQDICDGLNDSAPPHFAFQFHGLENRMDPATEIVIYRIIQELLNNVVKHARATEVLVQLMRHENNLSITVEDNGIGFDLDMLKSNKGAGLANVRSRVDYLKADMDMRSEPGKGTSVHIECNVE